MWNWTGRVLLAAIIIAAVSLIAYGADRWRAEWTAHETAEKFISALLANDRAGLESLMAEEMRRNSEAAPDDVWQKFDQQETEITGTIQNVRLDGQTAVVRCILTRKPSRVVFALTMQLNAASEWKIDGVEVLRTFPPS
ncbi:hypothetical protein [Thalassoroseus pseudoceratinae]|uniref:hypothetical protein n=1 Tax=Thalassoroseus pseudoceratinae TaxID=2713176 RepID=UPI001421A715|nr:hypothetical protein [Thalassoroseus pseudoceratinae]